MASTHPTELPPVPSEPGQPEPMPTELPAPVPDSDVPDPMPSVDPGTAPGQPMDSGLTGDFA